MAEDLSHPPVAAILKSKTLDALGARVYHQHANAWQSWVGSALGLLQAGEVIKAQLSIFRPGFDLARDVEESARQLRLSYVMQMLRGMGVEALLKALWLHAGRTLVVDGRVEGIPTVRDHDLRRMAAVVLPLHSLKPTPAQNKLLDGLAASIVSGRYPVSNKGPPAYWPLRQSGQWSAEREPEVDELLSLLIGPLVPATA